MLDRRGILLTLATVAAVACGNDVLSPPAAPSAAPPSISRLNGVIDGVVRGEIQVLSDGTNSMPLADAIVEIKGGPSNGVTTHPDSQGRFTLEVQPGTFMVVLMRPGYFSWQSGGRTISSEGTLTLPPVVLKTAPWSIAGIVTDVPGNPLAGARVRIEFGGKFRKTLSTTTDALGAYRMASSEPRGGGTRVWIAASAAGTDDEVSALAPCCNPAGDTIQNFTLVRIGSVTITGPDTLRVGEFGDLPRMKLVLDNETRDTTCLPASTDRSIVNVEFDVPLFRWGLRGARPGLATLTCEYKGVTSNPLPVRVVAG